MNKLLLAANEKGLASIMLRVRNLQGSFAGGERRLILRPQMSRNTLIVSMLTTALDMGLSFHERDMHTDKRSTVIPMMLKRLDDYSERLRKAMYECEPDAQWPVTPEPETKSELNQETQAQTLKSEIAQHEHLVSENANTQVEPETKVGLNQAEAAAIALAMDALSIEIASEQLSQPYALERDALLSNAKGRSITLQSSDDKVLSIGQKNALLPQAFGDVKLLIKVAKKGDEPAQDFELDVNIKEKSSNV